MEKPQNLIKAYTHTHPYKKSRHTRFYIHKYIYVCVSACICMRLNTACRWIGIAAFQKVRWPYEACNHNLTLSRRQHTATAGSLLCGSPHWRKHLMAVILIWFIFVAIFFRSFFEIRFEILFSLEQTPQTCAGRLFIFIVNQSVYLIWCSCGYIYSIYVLQPCVNICKQIYINIYIIYMRLNLVKFFQESSRDHDFLSLIEVSH